MSALSWPPPGHLTGVSSGETHLDFKPVDTSKTEDALRAAETACQLAIQQIPREVEVSQELLRYPEGEEDAVPITERDMEELQPGKFLGNNIVDFYIRFLRSRLSPEQRKRFYFFNSFFFRKLSENSAPTRIDPCKVDYEHLRRWTEKVNLFEKDYVFIPILESSHWSLVIICHLNSLTCAPEEMIRFPCMVHLDPIEGHHGSFEGLIRSYVLQAWMERLQPSNYKDHKDQLLALYQMKYVQAKVPQQANSYDCGLFVLNYIEVFLVKSTLPNFNFNFDKSGVHFTSAHFATEVLDKRKCIQVLILELIQISQERTRKLATMKNLVGKFLQASQNLRSFLYPKGHSQPCIQDVQLVGPSFSNSEDCGITLASNHEDSMDVQHQQSPLKLREDDEPLNGPQIGFGFVEYENGSENLSPQEQHVEFEMQTVGPTDFEGSILMGRHASTHEDPINVQHQPSSKIARLNYEQVDGLGLQSVKFQSFSDKSEEIPCMDLSGASKGKYKRGKNMTHEETSMLLSCKMEGGRFCKGSGGATHWNLISKEIEKQLGSQPSADQCRLRYDTLLKAYKTYKKYCNKTSKTFFTITNEERLDLKVATTLSEEWYTTIGEICDKAKFGKRSKINHGESHDLHPLSPHDSLAPTPPPISNGRSFKDGVALMESLCGTSDVALGNLFQIGVLNSLNEGLQSTLFNLVQECLLINWYAKRMLGYRFSSEKVCRRLAILQDYECNEILSHVFKLWELKLVSVRDVDFEEGKDLDHVHLLKHEWSLNLLVYKVILEEVLGKNPHLKTYYSSFPIEESSLQYVKLLHLYHCGHELKHLDLKDFPNLRFLEIFECPQFKLVTGWEVATSLESIYISWCNAYHDFPNLQYLFSLREFVIKGRGCNKSTFSRQLPQFRQCIKLQRLEIWEEESMSKIVDLTNLKDLKFLKHLALGNCTFSNIQGLSRLQTLKTLCLMGCKRVRSVPYLGCLKELTKLDMSFSGVEDVEGVGELHSLTSLNLLYCKSLERLPFLGHLKALIYLNLSGTSVKETPGIEDLIDLKTMHQ